MCLTYRSFCIGHPAAGFDHSWPQQTRLQQSWTPYFAPGSFKSFCIKLSKYQNILAHYPKIHQNTVCQVHHDIRAFACHEFDRIPWHLWQSKLGKMGKNCSSEVAPVPGPSPLLAGDFATLQRLLSDSVGSDARGPPALCLQDLRVEVRPWTAYRCSGQYIENTQ